MRYSILWVLLAVAFMLVALLARHVSVLEAVLDGVVGATVLILLFRWQDRFLWRER